MCYSGTCPHEDWNGECLKRMGQLCPESFEDEEDFNKAEKEIDELEADNSYQRWLDKQIGGSEFSCI